MAAGLPVICNNAPPMSDFLIDAGEYVDFLNQVELVSALKEFIENLEKRVSLSSRALHYSQEYGWASASKRTFNYLHDMTVRNQKN